MRRLRLRRSFAAALLLSLLLVLGTATGVNAADDFEGLVAAIRAANASGGGTITLSGDIVLSAALPPITGRVTIDGGGHSISGEDAYRIFDLNGGSLTLSEATLTDGNAGEGFGGAIRMRNGARLVIENSTLSGHRAKSGGAIIAYGGTVRITDSRFEKNCALSATFNSNREGANRDSRTVDANGCTRIDYDRPEIDSELSDDVDGGAIRLLSGAQSTIERSVFTENLATFGGAISSDSKNIRLRVSGSSFDGNRASWSGGAIGAAWSGGGSVSIDSSSFVENSADKGGGGAIEALNFTLDIVNSTFSQNHVGGCCGGGALSIGENAEVTVTHATFVDNRSRHNQATTIRNAGGSAYLRNSIIVSGKVGESCVGAWDQNIGNLSTDGTCADRPSGDPRLGEVKGSPAYYPLRDHSPAVDYANPEFCLETDQVGTPRPQGGGCDIGAIEGRGVIAAEPTPVPPLVCTLAYQIIAANRDQPASGCPAGSGVDTISLDRDIILFEPLPAITSHIIIEGNGHIISGAEKYRIFDVDGGTLTVNNLTMTGGYSDIDSGGAIRLLNGGRAVVNDSRITKNTARLGGAAYIGWQGTDHSRLTLNRTFLSENRSRSDANGGGAIYAGGGAIAINDSSFAGNSAGFGKGSAIMMVNPRSRLDIVNTSFVNRTSISVLAVENGVIATLTHVTIHAPYAVKGALHTTDSAFDPPGKFNLRNSIIVGPLTSAFCDNLRQNIGNLIEGGWCSPRLSGDPMLEEPVDGATHISPLPGSPAIGAADARFCTDTDQLGRPRALVGPCDIGAIEAVPVRQALAACAVTTTHALNFRDGPGGAKIGLVAEGATLAAAGRTPRWFEVEHEGETGWISADYVVKDGDCELE
ncbi:MAG: SH3 domain-containing protein [Chloroflexi bacterium]|nr:SH3 domain-containing protein [Chloroflexota bacterium]